MASITLSIEQVHPNADHVIVAAYVRTSTLYEKAMPRIGTTLDAFQVPRKQDVVQMLLTPS